MILESILNEGPVDMALAAVEDAARAAPKGKLRAAGQAPCEVWSGDGENLAGFLGAALEENENSVRVELHGPKGALYASPDDEGRAAEIFRVSVEVARRG